MFEGIFFGCYGGHGADFFFNMGGASFFFGIDDDGFYDDDDDWDSQWDAMHDEEEVQKDSEAAEILWVGEDATQDEIRCVFCRKVMKYHLDKFCPKNHDDGMTKQEVEEHFKELNSAYNCLMSKLDD